MSTKILLVHGAAHDETCWSRLTPLLDEYEGIDVQTITLSGHGDNRHNHFRVSMQTYANDICRRAGSMGGSVVVVGHSLAGVAISMAVEQSPELFRSMIYLAALVPDGTGRSLMQTVGRRPKTELDKMARISLLRGSVTYPQEHAATYFYSKCSAEERAKAARRLCAQPVRPFLSKLPWSNDHLGVVPKTYIECTDDVVLPIDFQREMQSFMNFDGVFTLESDHSPFLSMPEETAQTIATICEGQD